MTVLLVGLLSGGLGVALGALLQMRGQRIQQLRDRQISAAADYAGAALEVYVALSARMESLGDPNGRTREWLAGFKESADEARANVHEATRRLAMLELLFGVGSPTAAAGADASRALLRLTEELRKEPGDLDAAVTQYNAGVDAACKPEEPASPAWLPAYEKRKKLEEHLQLEVATSASFRAGIAILAPLASALVGLLLGTA